MRDKFAIQRDKIANMRNKIANMRNRIANMRDKIVIMRDKIAKKRNKIAIMSNKIAKKSNKIACFTAGKAIIFKEHPVNSIQFRSVSVSMDFCKIILPEKTIYTRVCNIAALTPKKKIS
jgi:Mg2+ and Co2+ transporter CorA